MKKIILALLSICVLHASAHAAEVDREVAISDVSDLTILREAQRELGIKGK